MDIGRYGMQGSFLKEHFVRNKYGRKITVSYRPFRKMGQGVYTSSEVNQFKLCNRSKSNKSVATSVVWDNVLKRLKLLV